MKNNLFDQHMMTVIVSSKCRHWLEDMTDEYKKDHPCNESSMTIGICAAILLETMCMNYESKGLWKNTKGEKNDNNRRTDNKNSTGFNNANRFY